MLWIMDRLSPSSEGAAHPAFRVARSALGRSDHGGAAAGHMRLRGRILALPATTLENSAGFGARPPRGSRKGANPVRRPASASVARPARSRASAARGRAKKSPPAQSATAPLPGASTPPDIPRGSDRASGGTRSPSAPDGVPCYSRPMRDRRGPAPRIPRATPRRARANTRPSLRGRRSTARASGPSSATPRCARRVPPPARPRHRLALPPGAASKESDAATPTRAGRWERARSTGSEGVNRILQATVGVQQLRTEDREPRIVREAPEAALDGPWSWRGIAVQQQDDPSLGAGERPIVGDREPQVLREREDAHSRCAVAAEAFEQRLGTPVRGSVVDDPELPAERALGRRFRRNGGYAHRLQQGPRRFDAAQRHLTRVPTGHDHREIEIAHASDSRRSRAASTCAGPTLVMQR